VATRSPIAARPAKVCWLAPRLAPSRAISARPRVISMALVLSPSPMPTAIPTASAITFFTAPPSSQPITSGLVYGRKYGVWQACWSHLAVVSSVLATTVAAYCRSAISRARLGPVITAIRSGGAPVTSAITPLIRRWLPCSMPFIRLTSSTRGGSRSRQPVRFWRNVWAGTASTTRSAPASATTGSAVAFSSLVSEIPGRYAGFSCRALIASASSGRRPQRTAGVPASQSTWAKVVPHMPAPMTAAVTPGPPRGKEGRREVPFRRWCAGRGGRWRDRKERRGPAHRAAGRAGR